MPREYFADSFALDKDAQALLNRLRLLPELQHTKDARLVAIASQIEPRLHGAPCRAFICKPGVQGPLAPWFGWALAQFCRPLLEGASPDFLIIFDAALWGSMNASQREALIYHELCHLRVKEDPDSGAPKLDDEGRPILLVMPHDHELFEAEIRRYGPVALELDGLVAALRDGTEHVKRQRRVAS